MDAISLSAIIIAVIAALKSFITETHIQKCKGCCIESDCRQSKIKTPPQTPIINQPTRENDNNNISEV